MPQILPFLLVSFLFFRSYTPIHVSQHLSVDQKLPECTELPTWMVQYYITTVSVQCTWHPANMNLTLGTWLENPVTTCVKTFIIVTIYHPKELQNRSDNPNVQWNIPRVECNPILTDQRTTMAKCTLYLDWPRKWILMDLIVITSTYAIKHQTDNILNLWNADRLIIPYVLFT